MSEIVYTKDEIKQFLEEQGYDVSDEVLLNKFIHDLKKVIKYEEKKKRRVGLGHHPEETVLDSTVNSSTQTPETPTTGTEEKMSTSSVPHSSERSVQRESRERDRGRTRDSSNSRKSPAKGRGCVWVPVTGKKQAGRGGTKGQKQRPDWSPAMDSDNDNQSQKSGAMSMTGKEGASGGRSRMDENRKMGLAGTITRPQTAQPTSSRSRPQTATSSCTSSVGSSRHLSKDDVDRPRSARDNVRTLRKESAQKCEGMEPDELFYVLREIMFPEQGSDESVFSGDERPKKVVRPPPHIAIDPVALYHWYKNKSWDVHPVPGEDRHMKLRWNVRAKTIGGPHPCNYK